MLFIAAKFSQEEMPEIFDPGNIRDLKPQDFVVVPRGETEDVAFVAALEHKAKAQVKLRRKGYPHIIRRATEDEVEDWWRRKALEKKAIVACKEKARELKLDMKVTKVRVEKTDHRAVFYFTADQRVDFRTLVRELSAILKMRIDLWQVGVRDEARMLDGFGVCGLKTCCSTWLEEFRPITIRMAKIQDITLPPSKLSGQCGRLLCCLSYEVDQYKEMSKNALPKGATIKYGEGEEGIIIDRNLLKGTYLVSDRKGSLKTLTLDETEQSAVRIPSQMTQFGKEVVKEAKKQSISEMMNAASFPEATAPPSEIAPSAVSRESPPVVKPPVERPQAEPQSDRQRPRPPKPQRQQRSADSAPPKEPRPAQEKPDGQGKSGRGKKKKKGPKPVINPEAVPNTEQPAGEKSGRRKKKRR